MDIQNACDSFRVLLEEQMARIANMNNDAVDYSKKDAITIGIVDGDGIGPIITAEAVRVMERLLGELEARERPTVVVLFGDHKPWMGNADSVYTEIGANFDLSRRDGFENYYGTPYLIWANSAAKSVLERGFVGEGGDFSPCFLMPKLFDLCGWEGPGFMQMARQMRHISPLVHTRGLFLDGDTLTDTLSGTDQVFYRGFLAAQYYREKELDPEE